ncbi:phosphoribosylanthranilate isomerase [Candidatus Zinderia endosymbiont of Aphrophora alni]|uniref:phosphoribosylanthranilate isomerase n=1 Tax=Candidatus Zinderia endosymbiont of Aphrophora alni TaxID=3077951 RepID=UPI0030D252C8
MYKTKIKICGLTKLKDIKNISLFGINAMGFVFFKQSPRYINPIKASNLIKYVSPFTIKVGLFVNQNLENIKYVLKYVQLSLLQFHGDETPEECSKIAFLTKLPFIKAIRIKKNTTSIELLNYEKKFTNSSIFFKGLLLDTFNKNYGGSGKTFNWDIIPNEIKSKIILSGGININNISKAIKKIKPYAIDISSGVEKKKGIKDIKKIKLLIKKINLINFK